MLVIVLAILDLLLGIVLLAWWALWSTRMLALAERQTAAAVERLNIARESAVDTREIRRRLSE